MLNKLGLVKCVYNGEEFKLDNISSVCKIHYDSDIEKYLLLIPEKKEVIKTRHTKKVIALDPGLRKFMTGLSENECVTICTNGLEELKKLINILF